MAFAPPAVRANFLYNGDLYVDVGNLNRHKRASIAEITEILRPDLKKPKNGAPVKDPVGHWYEAQLIHYGLPPSKDKARAKMRLLENLNNSNLKVPASVATIESELKKEFTAAERKAKAQHKASLALSASGLAKTAQSKKRKEPESGAYSPIVNVNINFGASPSPPPDAPTPAKKRKLQTARRGARAPGPPPELSHAAFQQNTSNHDSFDHVPAAESPKARQFATKQTARRSRPFPGPGFPPASHSYFQKSPAKKGTQPKKEQKPIEKKEPKPKREPAVKKEPTVKKDPKIKTEPNTKRKTAASPPSATTGQPPSLGLINGIYDISCPTIEQEWPSFSSDLTLILTLDTPSVWGAYDFGMFCGILHLPQRPYSTLDELELRWRGRENGEGEMSFGENCGGVLCFRGNDRIEGWMNLYGECWFEGIRREEAGTLVRTAGSMREEWEGYCEDEYEQERVGRWR
ncbi:MAG: hypothetical protein Q9188_001720 [Gyalolechia gomerana]